MREEKGHVGSSFEDFLKEENCYQETIAIAIKRVLAWQLMEAMNQKRLSKSQMARQMNTSRAQLDRILDPENPRIQLDTMIKAAKVVGRELKIELA